MSKYTTEVRFICEFEAGLRKSAGFNDVDSILNASAPKIFSFDFPIFDENYRLVLEKQILRHYYTREICMETVGAWKLKLQDRLNLIMPKYNKLYESARLDFNPFYDVDLTTDHRGENHGSSRSDSSSEYGSRDESTGSFSQSSETERSGSDSNDRWDLYSDTPQGGIQGIANAADPSLANNAFLTNARHVIDSGENSDESESSSRGTNTGVKTGTGSSTTGSTGTVDNTDAYLEKISGKRGHVTYSKMLQEYRETFINIDLMIVNELSDLFFGLWE